VCVCACVGDVFVCVSAWCMRVCVFVWENVCVGVGLCVGECV